MSTTTTTTVQHNKNRKINLIRVHGIVTLKNTALFFKPDTKTYHLMHYFTELARIEMDDTGMYKRYKVLKVLQTHSYWSSFAIYRLTDYLGIPRKIVKEKMTEYTDFEHHEYGTKVKVSDEQFIESLEKVL